MRKILLILLLSFLTPFVVLQATIHEVEVTNFSYIPASLTIEDGDTVRYLWIEGNHPTVSGVDGNNDEVFTSFPMNSDNTVFDLVLPGPGEYPYFCAFHFMQGMLGSITVNADANAGGPCGDLFFSEYIEGTSFNKALEIYNPTAAAVDLSGYYVRRYNNGSLEVSFTDTLQGSLAPGETFLIADPDAGDFLSAIADFTSDITSVNGDDAIELLNGTVVIDAFGVVGDDPGDEWVVGSGSSRNNTLVRRNFVQQGQLDWNIGATEWDVFPIDDFTNAGSHDMIPCEGEIVPFASLSGSAVELAEESGSYTFSVNLTNGNDEPTELSVAAIGGTATAGSDYDFTSADFSLDANTSSVDFEVTIINDDEMESDETIEIALSITGNGNLGTALLTITIDDDDTPTQTLSIVDATVIDDMQGIPVNDGAEVLITGITHGVNLSGNGLQFALIDATGGIQVFAFQTVDGYVYAEGDELEITGTIGQFNGLTQLAPLSINVLSNGNDLFAPAIVTALDESTESEHISFECMEISEGAGWDGEGTGDNVMISNGTDEFLMRIDDQTDVFGTDVPTSVFNLSGIGGQFDQDAPYFEGYQIFPMSLDAFDFSVGPVAEITAEQSSDFAYTFSATEGLENYEWNFGDGNSASGSTVEHEFSNPGMFTVVVNFTGEGSCTNSGTTSFLVDVMPVGLEEQNDFDVQMIPNPSHEFTLIKTELPIENIKVFSLTGQELMNFLDINAQSYQLNIGSLNEGIYLILVENQAGSSVQKLIRK